MQPSPSVQRRDWKLSGVAAIPSASVISLRHTLNCLNDNSIVLREELTTNTIASSYSGDDIQMKIRNCISNYVKNSGTTYVVLGGDDIHQKLMLRKGGVGLSKDLSRADMAENVAAAPVMIHHNVDAAGFYQSHIRNGVTGAVDDIAL